MKAENVTCIQRAQFLLPFDEAGEWRRREKTPWKKFLSERNPSPEDVEALANYTYERMCTAAHLMAFLLKVHDDWDVSTRNDGILLETETMSFEEIIPKITAAGFSENDYILYTEYTRKWGML